MNLVQVIENYSTVSRRWRLAAGIVLEDPQVVQLLRAKKLGPNFIKGLAALERRARALQKAGHTALNFSLKPKSKPAEPGGRVIVPDTPEEAAETLVDPRRAPTGFPPEDLSKDPGIQELMKKMKARGGPS